MCRGILSALKDDHRIGVTPILLRRAGYYLSLGVGEYFPTHPHFDKVTVATLYDIMPNPINETEWGLGMRVSFFKHERLVRWVEFGCRTVGAGGDDILRKVDEENG
jgi:hypothetical protein